MKKITDYKISLCHPSYGRPEMATKTAKKWLERAKNPERIQYIMCLSDKDIFENIKGYNLRIGSFNYSGTFQSCREDEAFIETIFCPEASLVSQTNFAAKHSTGDIILILSDDTDCPENWDELLLQGIEEARDKKGVDSFFTVKCKDGIQPFLITMPVIDRAWYEKFGYVFYPEFSHMYCDSDLSMVSHMLDRTLYVDILFPHLHYSVGGMEKDSINEKNDSTYNSGAEIYGKRGGRNFDLKSEEIINKELIDIYNYNGFEK